MSSYAQATTLREIRAVRDAPSSPVRSALVRSALGVLRRGAARDRAAALPAIEYQASGHRLDADRLATYQRLCGFDVSSAVPATFVHVQTFPLSLALMAAADFPFPLLGLVHVHNRITQLRPLDAGEALDLRVWADDLRPHPAGQQVDIRAEAGVDGETVWSGTSTYLHRTGSAAPRPPRSDAPAPPPAVAVWRLPGDLGRRYAAVSGDRNPIHLSRLSARAFGFPRAIAHGMWLNARVLGAMQSRLPDGYTVDVAFKTPALLPSGVAFSAVPTTTVPTGTGWDLGLRNARSGKPHLTATIEAVRPTAG